MKQNSKAILIISITLGLILLVEILVGEFFPNLTFVKGNLTIANRILGYFAFSGFILSIPIFFKATKIVTIPLGVILFLIFFINSCAAIYPIDTTTQPQDISVLQTNEDGSKLIVRERINAKTNRSIRDTTLVKDNFIFRQVIEPRK
ncbi:MULTISPECIES: hypothetical protein [unclassified Flavobacterium]|uniref:hypothetical protein n=1 Tax=unclassified Flavobacterium TaxID=196869 RepID=UPI0036118FCE